MKKRHICLLVLILWNLLVWGQSMMPAAVSSEESGLIVALINNIYSFLHITPDASEHIIRKVAHFSEYGVLGLFVSNYKRYDERISNLIAIFYCLMVALIDETIQLNVIGRSGQITDVWIDFAGAMCVILIYNLIRRAYHEKKNSNSIRT